jgi:hypothetical protein
MHTGRGDERGIRVYPPFKIFAKLVNKNAIKCQKECFPPLKISTTPINPPSQNLAKTSWTLPLDFQTMCIYVHIHKCVHLLINVKYCLSSANHNLAYIF